MGRWEVGVTSARSLVYQPMIPMRQPCIIMTRFRPGAA